MKSVKSIVFDLDGTLIDSVPDVQAAINRILEQIGRRPLSLEETVSTVGEGATAMIEKALTLTGEAGRPDQVEDFRRRYLTAYLDHPGEKTVIYPGVIQTLETLQSQGMIMGICTNKPQATTLPVLNAIKLNRFFCAVTSGDNVPYRKPDGRHVILTLEKMNAPKNTAVFVGDSETDIDAAKDANIPSIAVSYGYCHMPLDQLGADETIDHFPDLLNTLKKL